MSTKNIYISTKYLDTTKKYLHPTEMRCYEGGGVQHKSHLFGGQRRGAEVAVSQFPVRR